MPGQVQLLIFCLDDRLYALPLAKVVRVVHAVDVTPLPGAPDAVLGVIDLQGEIVPVMDMRRKFGFPGKAIHPGNQFIIARTSRRTVAMCVDGARGVIEYLADDIVGGERIIGGLDQIDGVIQLPERPALIHDIDRFLSLDQERALSQAIASEARS